MYLRNESLRDGNEEEAYRSKLWGLEIVNSPSRGPG